MIEYTEYHECQGIPRTATKYEPEWEFEMEEIKCEELGKLEKQFAITNNLAMVHNCCQSAKFHLSYLGDANGLPEQQRIEIIRRSVDAAIAMIKTLEGLLEV